MRRTFRMLRALWRYRADIEQQGREYQVELATLLASRLRAGAPGRVALRGYRLVLRAAAGVVALLLLVGALLAWAAWDAGWEWGIAAAALPVVAAAVVGWWWLAAGAPLRWLDEHADLERDVQLAEVPSRLRALARDTRTTADARRRLAQHLEDLAAGR